MAFKSLEEIHLARFNSATSYEFLDEYDKYVENKIIEKSAELKHQTIAPSGMYCKLMQWFRLRGTEPDKIDRPDVGLNFTAEIGSACHEIIQSNISSMLGDNWLSVPEYLSKIYKPEEYTTEQSGYETRVHLKYPPVMFAVDGLIRYKDKIRLFEIKSSDRSSFDVLKEPKVKHIDQIKTYCSLLHLDDAIVFYIDRMYGDTKCFEMNIPEYERDELFQTMCQVTDMASKNLAPEGLPKGDARCSSNMCPYHKKCKQWRI